jgi:LysR family transcriptional regulator, transcriptional activator of the cysJI operon
MDVRRLQAFSKVYTLRSFSRAGEELRLSQPTISAHVLALEEELGAQLFDRLGRSVLPTQAGEVLFRYARKVFAELEHARGDILALSQRVAGELVIGGSTIPAHYLLPRLMARFLAAYPEVRLELRGGDTRDITELVQEGTIHVGLVGAAAVHQDLIFRPILDDALVIAAPVGLASPDLDGDGWQERLLALPWVMREPGSGTREAFRLALEQVGIDARLLAPVLSVHSSLAVLECVEAGLGVSVVSQLAATPYLDRGAIRLIEAPALRMRRQFFTVYHARRYQFPALKAFLDVCQAV